MANITYARLDRVFNINREFWNIGNFRCALTIPKSTGSIWRDNVVTVEYANNAHPHQEYLADLKMARALIKQQLEKIQKEGNILDKIDEAIEATTVLALEELTNPEVQGRVY